MKIKRFVAADMRTALRMVRAEHGPDAVILSNRRTEEGVEIVAASNYDEDAVQRALVEAQRASVPAPPPPAAMAEPTAPAPHDFAAAMAAALATPTARAVSVLPPEVVMAHPAQPAAPAAPEPMPAPVAQAPVAPMAPAAPAAPTLAAVPEAAPADDAQLRSMREELAQM